MPVAPVTNIRYAHHISCLLVEGEQLEEEEEKAINEVDKSVRSSAREFQALATPPSSWSLLLQVGGVVGV